jgi:hypothetical protein
MFKLNYPSYKGKIDSKKDTLEKYKFSICYENAIMTYNPQNPSYL